MLFPRSGLSVTAAAPVQGWPTMSALDALRSSGLKAAARNTVVDALMCHESRTFSYVKAYWTSCARCDTAQAPDRNQAKLGARRRSRAGDAFALVCIVTSYSLQRLALPICRSEMCCTYAGRAAAQSACARDRDVSHADAFAISCRS